MNYLEQELEEQKKMSYTENGALGYGTTKSALLDLNFQVGSLRGAPEEEIQLLFEAAFYENKAYALKWLFYARDVREGLGERRLFRICYKRLGGLDFSLFRRNLGIIAIYGRWDDLVSLYGISENADAFITATIKSQLERDLISLSTGGAVSLLAKWLPSENASSIDTKNLAKKVRRSLKMTSKEYRQTLSKLRKRIGVVERQMCSNEWDKIDYERVPSMANLKYKEAFLRNDYNRRLNYLGSVASGSKKMNMNVATPVDIVSRYMRDGYSVREIDHTLELAWRNLKNISIHDTLVVADGSGSMTVRVGGGSTRALDVANALAIYSSEHNQGVYRNKYITFSSRPQLVSFEEDQLLAEKIKTCLRHDECSNTNIQAVFELILNTAIANKLSQDEMVKNVLIISDMEFDRAQTTWGGDAPLTMPLFKVIQAKYEAAGYKLPRLIFWNVNSRTKIIPLIENELGVTLVSGFSQNVLKMVMSEKYDPYEVLIETITAPRYDKVRA